MIQKVCSELCPGIYLQHLLQAAPQAAEYVRDHSLLKSKNALFFCLKEPGILNPQKAGHLGHQFQTLRNPEKGKFHPEFDGFIWGVVIWGVTKKQEFGRHFGSGGMGADITDIHGNSRLPESS